MDDKSYKRYQLLIFLTDAMAALIAVQIALWASAVETSFTVTSTMSAAVIGSAMIAMLVGIWSVNGYNVQRIFRIADEFAILFLGSVVGTGIFTGFLFFFALNPARSAVLLYALLMPPLAQLLRVGWRTWFKGRQAARIPTTRVLIVGAGTLGRDIGAQLMTRTWLGLELVGYVDDAVNPDAKTLGNLDQLERLCKEQRIDTVIVTLPLESHGPLAEVLENVHALPVQVKMVPDLHPFAYLYSRLEMFGGMPVIGLAEPVITPWQAAVKRVIDIALSGVGLLMLTPIMSVVAILVKFSSPGPIIFAHDRVGEGGKIFRMYKFRTMVQNAEQMLLTEAESDPSVLIKKRADPRITPLGSILRRFSVDELPQLWNILRGDMSIVGPRPELPYLVEQYEPWQRKRLLVPQGLTGWWQINGRSDKPMLLHTEDDLYYVRNYSLMLDLEIIWKTAWVVVRGKGAY